jgi:hypothetical protein
MLMSLATATRWTAQSDMSDPREFAHSLKRKASNVKDALNFVQGQLIHCDWLESYGRGGRDTSTSSRFTLPVHDRLKRLNPAGLDLIQSHPISIREVGTCRDYALLMCAMLRAGGWAARVRCGFASYFSSGWEDHWVCEYLDLASGQWLLADAQLDDVIALECEIDFHSVNVPRRNFKTAGEVWLDFRSRLLSPLEFGHGNTKGSWFIAVNVVRDHLALSDKLTSKWDAWREASEMARTIESFPLNLLDNLASDPEQNLVHQEPNW